MRAIGSKSMRNCASRSHMWPTRRWSLGHEIAKKRSLRKSSESARAIKVITHRSSGKCRALDSTLLTNRWKNFTVKMATRAAQKYAEVPSRCYRTATQAKLCLNRLRIASRVESISSQFPRKLPFNALLERKMSHLKLSWCPNNSTTEACIQVKGVMISICRVHRMRNFNFMETKSYKVLITWALSTALRTIEKLLLSSLMYQKRLFSPYQK